MKIEFLRSRFYPLAIGCLAFLSFAAWGPVAAQPFELFAVSDLDQVFEDGYRCPPPRPAIEVFGIRGEVVSAQCAIRADTSLPDVTVRVDAVRSVTPGTAIDGADLQWHFVGSIPVDHNTPPRAPEELVRKAPALFPDYLAEERVRAIGAGTWQGIWLTIRIPRDAQAGRYTGQLTVRSSAGVRKLPVHLTVYPLTLPEDRHIHATFWYTTRGFRDFHNAEPYSDRFYEILNVYAQNMADHRQNVFQVDLSSVQIRRHANGHYAFDFSQFDRWADTFWQTGRMDLLETGFIATFGEGHWHSREIKLRDREVFDEASGRAISVTGRECVPALLRALESHLREKKWLEKTVFHIADEPAVHNGMSWREISSFVHQYAPALRRIDAIEGTHFEDRLEVWVPKLSSLDNWFDAYRAVQRDGNELWYYTTGMMPGSYPNRIVDLPLIQSRLLHWLAVRFGLSGYLHYGWNLWTDDPYTQMREGKAPAESYQVYPAGDRVLNSLRWEQVRNGLQDCEYFWLLEDRIRRLKESLSERFSVIDPAQRGVELATVAVHSFTEYTLDPPMLHDIRRRVLEEILALDDHPRLVVQTTPSEFTRLHTGGRIEVYGWAESGAELMINGREVPVDADGLFTRLVRLEPGRTTVDVQLRKDGREKQTTRRFYLDK